LPGRTPTPDEVKIRNGNPGHRPLRDPVLVAGRLAEGDHVKTPRGFTKLERAAWRELLAPLVAGGILDRADLTLLEIAAQALARARAARLILATDGMLHKNSQGVVAHPAIAIEKGAMTEYRQLAIQLGIGPSGRTRLGRSAAPKPEGGMAGELSRNLPPPVRLHVANGEDE